MLKHALLCTAFGASATVLSAQADGFQERFTRLDRDNWHIAHYDFSHPSFDTDWRRGQIKVRNGLSLALAPHSNGINRFSGGSLRSLAPLHYGRYSAQIQPAKGEGLITGFFTYTGPYYGTRHDEIDIEFLGRDTTKMHLAWFVDGELHQKDIQLAFDAATCLHLYEFDWSPSGITWFVNGQQVYAVSTHSAPIPCIPGRLYANLWAVAAPLANWAGRPAPNTHARAIVRSIGFQPRGDIEPGS